MRIHFLRSRISSLEKSSGTTTSSCHLRCFGKTCAGALKCTPDYIGASSQCVRERVPRIKCQAGGHVASVWNKVPGGVVNQLLRDLWRESPCSGRRRPCDAAEFFFWLLNAISFPVEFMFGADYVHISRLRKSWLLRNISERLSNLVPPFSPCTHAWLARIRCQGDYYWDFKGGREQQYSKS